MEEKIEHNKNRIVFSRECKSRIVAKLTESLGLLNVEKGGWLEAQSYKAFSGIDQIPPRNVQKDLEQIIGDEPLSTFFYSRIGQKLASVCSMLADKCSLTSIPTFSDSSLVAASLVAELETLPWKYVLFLPLPLKADCGIEPGYELSKDYSLIVPTETIKNEFRLIRPGETSRDALFESLAGKISVREWNDKQFYLRGNLSGYVDDWFRTPTVDRFLSTAKSFVGLGIALFLFELPRSKKYESLKTTPIIAFSSSDQKVTKQDEHLSSRLEMDALQSFCLNSRIESLSKEPTKFYSLLTPPEGWQLGRDVEIKNKLGRISKAFKNSQRSSEVMKAGRWYFDGQSAESITNKFVQTTTSLEILLGDEDADEKLTSLMANRAAYMVGNDHTERERLISQFKEIYRVRSKIVHRGNSEFTSKDNEVWINLLMLCNRVIERELNLLSVDH